MQTCVLVTEHAAEKTRRGFVFCSLICRLTLKHALELSKNSNSSCGVIQYPEIAARHSDVENRRLRDDLSRTPEYLSGRCSSSGIPLAWRTLLAAGRTLMLYASVAAVGEFFRKSNPPSDGSSSSASSLPPPSSPSFATRDHSCRFFERRPLFPSGGKRGGEKTETSRHQSPHPVVDPRVRGWQSGDYLAATYAQQSDRGNRSGEFLMLYLRAVSIRGGNWKFKLPKRPCVEGCERGWTAKA